MSIASPKGGDAPIDPMSLDAPWISEAGQRFRADEAAVKAVSETLPLEKIDPAAFDAVYLVGGTATTWDFPHNAIIKRIVEDYAAADKIIAAICNGVIGLVSVVDAKGKPLVKDRRITAISNAEDALMEVDKIVPLLPEEVLRKLHASYSCAAPFAEHVVSDAPFFTGQNPASADLLARTIITHFETAPPADVRPDIDQSLAGKSVEA